MRCGWYILAFAAGSLASGAGTLALGAEARPNLQTLSDEALVSELVRFDLDGLLGRYAQTSAHSPARTPAVEAMLAAHALVNEGPKLPPSRRTVVIRQIVDHADLFLPALRDPQRLMRLANALITYGIERQANTIEYWGEVPRAQAEMRPTAELVARILDLVARNGREQADKIAESFGNTPSAEQLQQYNTLDNLAANARYTRLMADYYRALAYPSADPQRKRIAMAAAEALREFDQPDSNVQPIVRLRIGKLQLAAGGFVEAKATFATLLMPDTPIRPAPGVLQQHEALYFAAIVDLQAGRPEVAQAAATQLEQWQDQNLPPDKATREGAKAALAMLRYRLAAYQAQKAESASARRDAAARAAAILQQLAADRPELRTVIYEQLAKSIPADAAPASLDGLMLRALVQQALVEAQKSETPDLGVVRRGVAAAKELLGRASSDHADVAIVDDVAIALPQMYDRLGQPADAATAYLDYVAKGKSPNRPAAMQNALAAIAAIRQQEPDSPVAQKLLDRALPMAVNDLGRTDLAFDLGRRLQQTNQLSLAIAAYERVPADDGRYLLARYYRLAALRQLPESAANSAASREAASQVMELAHKMRAAGGTDAVQDQCRLIEARAMLIAARLMQPDAPADVVACLKDFAELIRGLPQEPELEAESLVIRSESLMALGRNREAADAVLALLQTRDGQQGTSLVFAVLKKIDAELDAARKTADAPRTRSLLESRAALSSPLVQWARSNPDAEIRKSTYQYMLFDAGTQLQAAMAQVDPARREASLRQVVALYDRLLDGEGIRLWAASVDATKVDLRYGDVAALFAKAQALYELGDYAEAAKRFGRLLEDRKLGLPRTVTMRDGELLSEDNPQYWEATYKLYRSNQRLARALPPAASEKMLQETRNGLKRLYIREGVGVGGEQWHAEFETLRAELLPDWKPETPAK